ncbi:MAG: ABC transporter permease [Actinomycetota bacterium]
MSAPTTLRRPTTPEPTAMTAPTASTPATDGPSVARLVWTELKLVLREPVVLTFVFAFPVITVLVLGGVFGDNDPAFEGAKPSDYYAAGYIGVVIAAIGLIMLPVHLAGYRERGVLRRFQVSSFRGWALPFAHLVVGVVMTAVGVVALLIAAWLSYGLPSVDDLPRTVIGAVLGTIAFAAVGVALGSLAPNARSAQGLGMLLFFPSFLLGGGGPPPEAMGDVMQDISNWIPLTHVIRSIQEPWLGIGSPTNHFVVVAVILVVATGLSLTLAARAER